MERYFSITLGASRIEFSVGVENNKYVGKINGKIHIENVDYEAVRSAILKGMEAENTNEGMH